MMYIRLAIVMVLVLIGYVLTLAAMTGQSQGRLSGTVAGILLVLYVLIGAILYLLLGLVQSPGILLMGALLICAAAGAVLLIRQLHEGRPQVSRAALALFLTWLLAVLAMTVLLRLGEPSGSHSTAMNLDPLAFLQEGRDSAYWLRHLALNVVLLLPFGALLPLVTRERPVGILPTTLAGLSLSVFIETLQLLLQIGQFDINDILGNTLGALLGALATHLVLRLRGGRRESD